MPLEIGSVSPVLGLPADNGIKLLQTSLNGRKVLLYFYPKSITPKGTLEAEEFRDRLKELEVLHNVIINVSQDNVKRHDKFKAKYQLLFTLVFDEAGTLSEASNVWRMKKLYDTECLGVVLSTYLIDKSGCIQAVCDMVGIKGHEDAVLKVAQVL